MNFVSATIHPKNVVNLDLSQNTLEAFLETASINADNIRRELVVNLFNRQKQGEVEDLVQNYQSLIIKLLNNLYGYQNDVAQNRDLINLYHSISDILVDVLTYIDTYFSK